MLAHDFHAQHPAIHTMPRAQLPQRLARLRRRGERLGATSWDINTLQLLGEDAALMADACRALDMDDLTNCLDALREIVAELLHPPRLPDQATSQRITRLIETLSQHQLPESVESAIAESTIVVAGPSHELGFPLLVTAPEHYWARPAPAANERDTHVSATQATRNSPPPQALIDAIEAMPKAHADATPGADGTTAATVTTGARTCEQLLHRVSECLAMEDSGIRAGGLLVFKLENAEQRREQLGAANHAALLASIDDFLVTHVGRHDIVANAGEGEFLLLNPDCDPGLLEAYALNLRDRIAREPFVDDASQRFVFDVGICPFVSGATQADAMHEAARRAIDTSVAAGRHGVFSARRIEAAIDSTLVERIRRALGGDGFQLLFQPIVSLRGEEDEQFQVLLRLQDHEQRLRTAAEVIPAAKSAGLLATVDRWVLEHCIQSQARRLRTARCPRLFVSQSLDGVRDAQIPVWLGSLLKLHQVSGDLISVELHSDDATRALADVKRYAHAMKGIGVGITLSGFTAGVLGDRLVQALPIDFIKLAPRYLRFDDAAIGIELRELVERMRENGKRVIAPRVEDARGAAALWAAGVDFIQGNFVQEAGSDLAFDFQSAVM